MTSLPPSPFVEQFDGLVCINHDLPPGLEDGLLENAVLVPLRGEVGDIEEFLNPLEAVDIPLAGFKGRILGSILDFEGFQVYPKKGREGRDSVGGRTHISHEDNRLVSL